MEVSNMKKLVLFSLLISILFLQSCHQVDPVLVEGKTHTLYGTIEYVNGDEDKKYFYEPEMDIYYSLTSCEDYLDEAGNAITIDDFAVDCNVKAVFLYYELIDIGWWIDSIQKV